jgi:hypothetical protein
VATAQFIDRLLINITLLLWNQQGLSLQRCCTAMKLYRTVGKMTFSKSTGHPTVGAGLVCVRKTNSYAAVDQACQNILRLLSNFTNSTAALEYTVSQKRDLYTFAHILAKY